MPMIKGWLNEETLREPRTLATHDISNIDLSSGPNPMITSQLPWYNHICKWTRHTRHSTTANMQSPSMGSRTKLSNPVCNREKPSLSFAYSIMMGLSTLSNLQSCVIDEEMIHGNAGL